MSKKPSLKKETNGSRGKPTTFADGREFDDVMTMRLPLVDASLFSTSAELRALPMLFPPSEPPMSRTWITDQPTWMVPVVPGPAKTGKQVDLPATQPRAIENKQTSSGAQGYLSLALEMVKSSGIYALGAFASPLVSLI